MNEEYQIAEKKGRDKLKRDFINSLTEVKFEFTDDEYDHIDCFATAGTRTFAIEIKNRDIPMNRYEKKGYILEKIKYDALIDTYKTKGYIPLYRCYFQDGQLTWDLTEIDAIVEYMFCTKTTATNYGDKIEKEIINLDIKDSVEWKRKQKNQLKS